jgi:hypothetical protein
MSDRGRGGDAGARGAIEHGLLDRAADRLSSRQWRARRGEVGGVKRRWESSELKTNTGWLPRRQDSVKSTLGQYCLRLLYALGGSRSARRCCRRPVAGRTRDRGRQVERSLCHWCGHPRAATNRQMVRRRIISPGRDS